MFSKALFKQSCKANGTMWAIITFAVCFMLACVMLISGSDSIGKTVTAIEDTIIEQEISAAMETRAINYYENEVDGMQKFDELFLENIGAETSAGSTNLQTAFVNAFTKSCTQIQDYVYAKALAVNPDYTKESAEAQEMLGSVMYAINPDKMFDGFYTSHGESIPENYAQPLLLHCISGDIASYLGSEQRLEYITDRSEYCSSVFLAGNITMQENIDKMIAQLQNFGVTIEKYESYGFTYANVKKIAVNTVITYRNRLDYEVSLLDGTLSESEYAAKLTAIKAELTGDIAASLLASLPEEVSSALQEIGKVDLYSLVVGSIFYKLAGLLLPIIYVIMASNNLIAGQVDSGSMAYVLSTSTKRQTVAFTQAMYLICSLLCMFSLTTVTGCICLAIVGSKVSLTYGNLILLNVGAFLVLFALSGLCFFTSCWFDRSKRSMAIGGGLSIFSLVAAMLGLFGSPVIPKVVRLDALNNFNYVTIITLFDAISIIDGTLTFLWKFAILLAFGAVGYVVGAIKFTKKDLPL